LKRYRANAIRRLSQYEELGANPAWIEKPAVFGADPQITRDYYNILEMQKCIGDPQAFNLDKSQENRCKEIRFVDVSFFCFEDAARQRCVLGFS